MTTNEYLIQQMDCPTEEQIIRNRLARVQGVKSMEFDLLERRLTVEHELETDQPIRDALKSVGMDPTVREVDQAAVNRRQNLVLGTALAIALAAEAITWTTLATSASWETGLAVVAIAMSGWPVLKKAWASVKTFTLNINFLMSLATVGAVALGEWSEASMVIVLFAIAEAVEARSLAHAHEAVRSLMVYAPPTALKRGEDGEFVEVLAGEVENGDVVRVKPGERIAFDGEILAGRSDVDQGPITGESMPVTKAEGDILFAGSLNGSGSLDFVVTHAAGDTMLDRIVATVQHAHSQRAPTQRFVDKFAKVYTPAVVALALLVGTVPPIFLGHFTDWAFKALVMLVIACPCAFVIATPITVVSAIARAARLGMVIKGGAHLERGAHLTDIAFDKTGTLTRGRLAVTDVEPLTGMGEEHVMQIAVAVEQRSEHPIAKAVMSWGDAGGLQAHEFQSFAGLGASAEVDGKRYLIGNHRWIHDSGFCSEELEAKLMQYEAVGKTTVVLTEEETPIAVIAVSDVLRETAPKVIDEIHGLGLRTHLFTGDNEATAKMIAGQANVADYAAELLPEEKLGRIAELSRNGGVAMVGDGINDAPALARADIGIAMGFGGSDTAIETADVALMSDDLASIPLFLRLSRATTSILIQNITAAILIKAIFMVLDFFGLATMWMAVFADMGVSLLVVANGLRLLRFRA